MSLPLEGRRLVALGCFVFPLADNSKVPPAGSKWRNGGASNVPADACDMFADGQRNYGIRSDDLVIIDHDSYKPGPASLAELGEVPRNSHPPNRAWWPALSLPSAAGSEAVQ